MERGQAVYRFRFQRSNSPGPERVGRRERRSYVGSAQHALTAIQVVHVSQLSSDSKESVLNTCRRDDITTIVVFFED